MLFISNLKKLACASKRDVLELPTLGYKHKQYFPYSYQHLEHFRNNLLTLLQQEQLRLIALIVQSKAEQSRPERVSAPQSTAVTVALL